MDNIVFELGFFFFAIALKLFLEINNLLNINKTIKGIYFFKKLKIALKSLKTKKTTSLKKI
jgi:hypothetical protein